MWRYNPDSNNGAVPHRSTFFGSLRSPDTKARGLRVPRFSSNGRAADWPSSARARGSTFLTPNPESVYAKKNLGYHRCLLPEIGDGLGFNGPEFKATYQIPVSLCRVVGQFEFNPTYDFLMRSISS